MFFYLIPLSTNKATTERKFGKLQGTLREDTLKLLGDLGGVLRDIHNRLIAEGYIIQDGKIYKHEKRN